MATERITFQRGDGTEVPAFATPAGPKAGLVVLQEWWGVNEQIKTTATDMAAACGVRVAIPDLYRSKIAYEAAEAEHLMSALDWPGAVADVQAAAAGLKAQGCDKVAVVGFCMGGALSLGCAVKHSEIDACIAFYGWNDGLADVATMRKPVQCHFGALDDIQVGSTHALALTVCWNAYICSACTRACVSCVHTHAHAYPSTYQFMYPPIYVRHSARLSLDLCTTHSSTHARTRARTHARAHARRGFRTQPRRRSLRPSLRLLDARSSFTCTRGRGMAS